MTPRTYAVDLLVKAALVYARAARRPAVEEGAMEKLKRAERRLGNAALRLFHTGQR